MPAVDTVVHGYHAVDVVRASNDVPRVHIHRGRRCHVCEGDERIVDLCTTTQHPIPSNCAPFRSNPPQCHRIKGPFRIEISRPRQRNHNAHPRVPAVSTVVHGHDAVDVVRTRNDVLCVHVHRGRRCSHFRKIDERIVHLRTTTHHPITSNRAAFRSRPPQRHRVKGHFRNEIMRPSPRYGRLGNVYYHRDLYRRSRRPTTTIPRLYRQSVGCRRLIVQPCNDRYLARRRSNAELPILVASSDRIRLRSAVRGGRAHDANDRSCISILPDRECVENPIELELTGGLEAAYELEVTREIERRRLGLTRRAGSAARAIGRRQADARTIPIGCDGLIGCEVVDYDREDASVFGQVDVGERMSPRRTIREVPTEIAPYPIRQVAARRRKGKDYPLGNDSGSDRRPTYRDATPTPRRSHAVR